MTAKKPTRKHIVIDARARRSSTGRYTDRLITHLQTVDAFHRYTILVSPDDTWAMQSKNFTTLPCRYAQFSLNPIEQLGFAWQLYKLKPDLVHFTMTQQPLIYFGKIVTTTHDLTMFHFVRRGTTPPPVYYLKMGLYRFLFKWSHLKSRRIIVPTNYVAADLAEYQPSARNKIVVTYEASEPPHAVEAQKPTAIHTDDTFIMYLGTAFPHKNLPRLLDAFTILLEDHPNLKLVLVGKKEKHYEELETEVIARKLDKHVIITGFLPDQEAKWLYNHTQAYVFPSLSEGFSLSGLEAIANGAVVVSSNATCLPEVYGDAVHYFNPKNPRDIAAKVHEVMTNPSLQEKLRQNGAEQLKKYSWQKMADETLVVYKSALDEINPKA